MKQLQDKIAVVTGAASGIGRATAVELARAGCHLAIADLDTEGLAETAAQVEAQGRNASTHQVNVADKQAMEAFAAEVIEAQGSVDILINNAGVALSQNVATQSLEDLEWIFGINFWGVVYGCHYFLPHIQKQAEGHIVNISSLFGLIGVPTQSAYCATKFAVRGYTESFRAELLLEDSPIGVTSVHPGGIDTNIAKNARHKDGMKGLSHAASVKSFKKAAITSPESAASQIVRAIRQNKPRLVIGKDAKTIEVVQRASPTGYIKLVTNYLDKMTK